MTLSEPVGETDTDSVAERDPVDEYVACSVTTVGVAPLDAHALAHDDADCEAEGVARLLALDDDVSDGDPVVEGDRRAVTTVRDAEGDRDPLALAAVDCDEHTDAVDDVVLDDETLSVADGDADADCGSAFITHEASNRTRSNREDDVETVLDGAMATETAPRGGLGHAKLRCRRSLVIMVDTRTEDARTGRGPRHDNVKQLSSRSTLGKRPLTITE